LFNNINVAHMIGIIHQHDKDRMRKLLYRALRGNALIDFKDISRPFKLMDGKEEYKTVFFVFF